MSIKEVIIWVFFGGLSGITVKWILPAKHEPQGCLMMVLIGILGAIVGGLVSKKIGEISTMGYDYYSLLGAIIGGLVLSIAFQLWFKRK